MVLRPPQKALLSSFYFCFLTIIHEYTCTSFLKAYYTRLNVYNQIYIDQF